MKKSDNLKRRRGDVLDAAKAVKTKAENDKRDLTDAELTVIEAKVGEAQTIAGEIEAAERHERLLLQLDEDHAALSATDEPRENLGARLTEGTGNGRPHHVGGADWKVGKANFEDDPNKGFRSHRDFLTTVMNVARGRAKTPDNLKFLATAGSDEHGTYADPYGGFLVPVGFSPQLLRIDPEADPMAGRTTMIPMATPQVAFPARVDKVHTTSVSGGLTVSRKAETAAATASRMTFEKVQLTAFSLFGLSYATEEVLADSAISFIALLAAGFSDQFTSHMIDERLNGNGIGEHLGVMDAANGSLVTITKETGQEADTIYYDNIIKMRARAWRYANAIWMANHDTIPQLALMNQTIGTSGVAVWQPSAREDIPDVLFGRPIIFTEYMNTLGDAGDIGLFNWAEYLEGLYQPLQSAESIHVRFVEHERAFKFWLRNAGAPWWRTALTPKNSTATLSPFVILGARA